MNGMNLLQIIDEAIKGMDDEYYGSRDMQKARLAVFEMMGFVNEIATGVWLKDARVCQAMAQELMAKFGGLR